MTEKIERSYHIDFLLPEAKPPLPGKVILPIPGIWDEEEVEKSKRVIQEWKSKIQGFQHVGRMTEGLLWKLKEALPGHAITVRLGTCQASCGPGPLTPIPEVFEREK